MRLISKTLLLHERGLNQIRRLLVISELRVRLSGSVLVVVTVYEH